MTDRFILPESTLTAVDYAPADGATLLLLRHSARGPLPAGESGYDVRLLPEGKALARTLGSRIGGLLATLHTSPVPRCVETAEALVEGAGVRLGIVEDTHLGHPGVYVADGEAAWETWQSLGHERVMAHLIAGDRLYGLADPVSASRRLAEHMRATAGGSPGVHVFVTHDSLVTTAAAHLLRRRIGMEDWPRYLEALVLVDRGDGLTATYRAWSSEVTWA